MNFNGAGGLMLLVVAALWLWVFVPSWVKRSEARQLKRQEVAVLRAELRRQSSAVKPTSPLSKKLSRADRLRRTRNTSAVLALALASISSTLAFIGPATEVFVSLIATSVSLTLILAAISLRAAKTLGLVTSDLLSSRRPERVFGSIIPGSVDVSNPRDWTPVALPQPKQNLVSVQEVQVAEVVLLQKPIPEVNLNEILARRRSNGY